MNTIFYYDEKAPSCLRWKISPGQKIKSGQNAGSKLLYWVVKYKGSRYQVHRIIWRIHKGEIPKGLEIDHINQNKYDNRIENLRLVTHQENAQNMPQQGRNSSGSTGVKRRVKSGFAYWVCFWAEKAKTKQRWFSILKYGEEGARELAVITRVLKLKQLNTNGAKYTELHGKPKEENKHGL